MAYVTPIYGGSAAQIDYRLGVGQDAGHGCGSDAQFRYRADGRERPLRWIGEGLPEFGVDGLVAGAELTPDQHDMARALMTGKHPVTGEQLVSPKLAVPADAKVPLGPLVAAVRALVAERDITDPVDVFTAPKLRSGWNTAVRAVARRGDAALLRVDDALTLVEKAGLEAEQVWPDTDLLATYSNLYESAPVVDEHGAPVMGDDGTPKTELVARRVPVGIVGFDIGVTLPKSASLLLAFLPDDLADRVEAGYTAAIDKTFGWVEGRTSYVRRGKHGDGHTARHESTAGFAGWVMTHRAARPVADAPVGDPHWHVHITVANMAKAADGTWLTVAAGGRDLMRHAPAIDKVTQAQIRGFLHEQFGITFTRRERNSTWEVAQIPDEAIVYFSKRGQQVNAVLEQLGYSNADVSAAHARVLTRESRTAKPETTAATDATLRGLWRADAFRGGLDPDSLMDQVLATHHTGSATQQSRQGTARVFEADAGPDQLVARFGISLDDLVTVLTDPDRGLTAHARRFSHLDAVAAVADALPYGAAIAEVERLTDLVLEHPAFVSLPASGEQAATGQAATQQVGQRTGQAARVVGGPGICSPLSGAHQMAGGQLYSTRDVTEAERTILLHATMRSARSTVAGTGRVGSRRRVVVPLEVVDEAVRAVADAQGYPLSVEQRAVLDAVVGSSRPVTTVEGPPGTGKTTLMRAARVAWEAAGHTVAGAATAAVAAQNLATESGIPSRTVAQWLWRIDNGPGLTGVDVLVLDEANLTSDRDRAALYRAAARSGTRIVEVGDPRQLRGVGEGSMFGYLHALLDGPGLSENRRQRNTDERAALAAFREGRHAEALHAYQRIGGLVATETADEAVAAMVSTWLRAREGAPDPHTQIGGLVMLAATNEQVGRINDAVQAVRAARGELGDARTYQLAGGRRASFHVGDLVMVRRNDRTEQAVTGAPVLNGYRGVITAITADGVEVAWRTDTATQTTAEPAAQSAAEGAGGLSRAVLSPGYIAQGGLELGYALTAHKAEGLTVGGQWVRPDGTQNDGTVLVYGSGMDNPGLYVSLSRDKGQAVLFAARTELEGEREDLLYGPPATEHALTDRVVAALAEQADATATTANDRPVLVDLGQAPANPAADLTAAPSTSTGAGVPEGAVPGPVPRGTEPVPAAAHHNPLDQGDRYGQEPDHGPDRDDGRHVVSVTGEQHQEWQEISLRVRAAKRDLDPHALAAAEADRRAFTERMGHYRMETLFAERHEQRVQDRARRAAAREAESLARNQERIQRLQWAQAWQARPHSRLTDTALNRAHRAAGDHAAREQAAADKTRRELAAREPDVTAGRGPRVTELDTRMHQLRVNAERQATVEALEARWRQALERAGDAAEQATHKEFDAERTSWWQSSKRDQLTAEAAAQREVVAATTKETNELASHAAEIKHQLGGPRMWSQARDLAERAEATYERDRDQALTADRRDLTRLERVAETHETNALKAAARHTELTAERDLRDTMPQPQHTFENELRAEQRQLDQVPELQQRLADIKHNLAVDPRSELHQDLAKLIDDPQPDPHEEIHRHIHHEVAHHIEDPHLDHDGPSLGL
ncbi:MobF family relaxase [Actinophytocola glycyrrhizae]|uniref:MobF family relaxase n=1 Tax=Actinophytocola glycyrrhizae TaxID=2044873 RepID=A0ABV9SCP5_9PSEU